MNTSTIKCPNCGTEIELADAMQAQMSADIETKLKSEREKIQADAERKAQETAKRAEEKIRADLEEKARQGREFQEKIIKDLQEREDRAKAETSQRIREMEAKAEQQRTENERTQAELKAEAEHQRIKNEKALESAKAKLEEEVRDKIATEARMKELGHLEQIASMTRTIDELKQKAEQQSQQLQGEVQEIALEEFLRQAFPSDIIEPVPKGMKGADVLQKVRTNGWPEAEILGMIIWESKRTKQFLNDWILKLKDDQRTVNAEVAMIVTQTMPAGVKGSDVIDGVWVVEFPLAIHVARSIRAGLIEVSRTKKLSNGSDEKTAAIFAYVTSNEFRQAIQTFAETFISFQNDLAAEKRAAEKQWKKREQTITRAFTAVSRMGGSFESILGGGEFVKLETNEQRQLE